MLREARFLTVHLDSNVASQIDTFALLYVVTSGPVPRTTQLNLVLGPSLAGYSDADLTSRLWPLTLLRSRIHLSNIGGSQSSVGSLQAQRQTKQPDSNRETLDSSYKAISDGMVLLERHVAKGKCESSAERKKVKSLRDPLKKLVQQMGTPKGGVKFSSLRSSTTKVRDRIPPLETTKAGGG